MEKTTIGGCFPEHRREKKSLSNINLFIERERKRERGGVGARENSSVRFMSKHQNIHIVTNILVFVSGGIKESGAQPLQPFTLSH